MDETFINALVDKLIMSTIGGDIIWETEGKHKFFMRMPFEPDDKKHSLRINVGSIMNPESKLPTVYLSLDKTTDDKGAPSNTMIMPQSIITITGLPDNVDITKKIALLFGHIYNRHMDKNVRGFDKKYVMDYINSDKTSKN